MPERAVRVASGCLAAPEKRGNPNGLRIALPAPRSEVRMSLGVERRLCGHGGSAPGQGPFMKIELHVVDDRVKEATYETYQCPGCHACGKALCGLVSGKTLEEARAVRHGDLVAVVGPLPAH